MHVQVTEVGFLLPLLGANFLPNRHRLSNLLPYLRKGMAVVENIGPN